jgi:Uma2 family endonuclease
MMHFLAKPIRFDEFIAGYPEQSETQYELHDGVMVEMPPPTGDHEEIIAFLIRHLILEVHRLGLPWLVLEGRIVKIDEDTSYRPDVMILNPESLTTEPLWKKASTVTLAQSIPVAIEVASTNWRDDYGRKLNDYEALGIPEYWIVDYLALGAKRYIGSPKQPTLSVFSLVEEEYKVVKFKGDEQIQSPQFPGLQLTSQQMFD